jgi:hypothetical protein
MIMNRTAAVGSTGKILMVISGGQMENESESEQIMEKERGQI